MRETRKSASRPPRPSSRDQLQTRKSRGALAGIGIILLSLSGTPAPIEAQGCNRGPVNCVNNTAAMQRTCTADLMCTNNPGKSWTISFSTSANVTFCQPANFTTISGTTITVGLVARAMTTAPTSPRSCVWNWSTSVGSVAGFASISSGDGLPVELMDFSVEGEASPPRAEADSKPERD